EAGDKLGLGDLLEYARQTAAGLAHAHRHGIVHRDIKTGNLMLTEHGSVKITDFGVAKLTAAAPGTRPGTLLGTIPYMSPARAEGLEVAARSDFYSFGVGVFELATGRLPFEAPNELAILDQLKRSEPPPLRSVRRDAPAAVEKLVRRTLEKRPE